MNTYEPTTVVGAVRDLVGFSLFRIGIRLMSPEGKRFMKEAITERVSA